MTDTLDALNPSELQDLAADLIVRAQKAGADAAEAAISKSLSIGLSVRDAKLDDLERSETFDAGVRVIVGKRQAGVAFSDLSDGACQMSVERAIAMAKAAPDDPYCALAEAERLETNPPAIQRFDPTIWSTEDVRTRAEAVEKAAREVDGVTKTDSAFASATHAAAAYATTTGFNRGWQSSSFGYGVSVIAEKDGAMERDYASTSARYVGGLRDIAEVGREAGDYAAKRVGPQKIASGSYPVVFDRRVAATFISSLAGAISGPAIARGVSFLRDKLDQKLFADGINVIDDPHRDWGHASCAFDGEGTRNQRSALIDDGRLTTWLHNSASARQLNMSPTGHGRRNMGGAPGAGATNLHLEAGSRSRGDMIGAVQNGVLIMEMFGPSLNSNTGDWSVGVSGYRIKDGVIDHPVSEITVAGNLIDIYARLEPASDLEFRGSVNSPSVFVDAMTVGGL